MTLTDAYLTNIVECGYIINKCFAYKVEGRMVFGILVMRDTRNAFALSPSMHEAFSEVIKDMEEQGRYKVKKITPRHLRGTKGNDLLDLLNANKEE